MTHRRRLRSVWNRVDSGEIHQAPRKWQSWLSDTGSLTQKIEQSIGSRLEVWVLRDERQNLNSDESRYFHFKVKRCRVREVLLCFDGKPLVMARSIIPTSSSSGSNQAILRLGRTPLGGVLFSKFRSHSKSRPLREIACLNKGDYFWKTCQKRYPSLTPSIWARRTLYDLRGHKLLVSELFLPELLQNHRYTASQT